MTDTVDLLSLASGAVISVTPQQAAAIYTPPAYVPVAVPGSVEAEQASYPKRGKRTKPLDIADGEITNGDPESPTIETES
jgi:hypothetical protein